MKNALTTTTHSQSMPSLMYQHSFRILGVLALMALCFSCPTPPGGGGGPLVAGSTPDTVHLAFAGGGWRAHTGHSAWTMSLLDRGTKTLDSVFTNVGTISSNSGGSWFSTMLMFSEDFVEAIEAPNAINTWDSTGWLGQQQKIFDAASCHDLKSDSFALCVFAAYLGLDALYWDMVVDSIVYKDYPIDKSVTLSGNRQPWAADKPLLLAATMLTNQVVLAEADDLEKRFYQACYNPSTPDMSGTTGATCSDGIRVDVTPVTFSSIPSGSTYKTAPFLSQVTDSKQSFFNLGYKQNVHEGSDRTYTEILQNPIDVTQVPVVTAAATSSAALGFLAIEDIAGGWTTSYTFEDEALSFQLVNSTAEFVEDVGARLEGLAENKTVRLADGGPVDNSGVAQLVSSLQQNNKANGFNIVAFDNVQVPYTPAGGHGADVGTDIAYLFGEGLTDGNKFCVDTSSCVVVPDLQIFELSSLTSTQETWSTPVDTVNQNRMLIYTKYTVTTKENEVLGIAGGTTGTLHAFSCVYPGATTVPMNETMDGSFIAYEEMLTFINSGLSADNQKGLKYLQAALGLTDE